jgi:hypothetical protein
MDIVKKISLSTPTSGTNSGHKRILNTALRKIDKMETTEDTLGKYRSRKKLCRYILRADNSEYQYGRRSSEIRYVSTAALKISYCNSTIYCYNNKKSKGKRFGSQLTIPRNEKT